MANPSYDELRVVGAEAAAAGAIVRPLDGDRGLATELGELHDEYGDKPRTTGLIIGWAAEWNRLGYPTVSMGHKYAAALMSTAAPEYEIRAPWRHFLIQVPDHMIVFTDRLGRPAPVYLVLCAWYPDRWSYIALAERCEYSQFWSATSKLRSGDGEVPHEWAGAFLLPMSSQDERARVLIDRLILNACAVMTGDPDQVKPIGKRPPGTPPPRMAADGSWSTGGRYELRRDVRVDCRQAVHDYLTGARHAAPAVRYLVRGHWRQQPHGTGRALRRAQWIEPFWKGMQDAPIAIRKHDLRRDGTATPAQVAVAADAVNGAE